MPNKRRYSIWHILSGPDHLFGKFIYLVRSCIRQFEMRSAPIIGKNAPVFGVAVNKKGTFSSLYLDFCVPVFGTANLYLASIHPYPCVWGRSIYFEVRSRSNNGNEEEKGARPRPYLRLSSISLLKYIFFNFWEISNVACARWSYG